MAVISGSSRFRNLFVHIFPNVLNTALVLATLDVGKMIIFESALSFLGLGVQPPTVTWGGLCADGRNYLECRLVDCHVSRDRYCFDVSGRQSDRRLAPG